MKKEVFSVNKRLAAFMAMVLIMTLLITSCTSGNSELTTTGLPTTPSGVSAINVFPIVTDNRQIVICTPANTGIVDYDTNEQKIEWEEYTGLKIKWQLLAASGYAPKINLMFSSNSDMPDAFFACDAAFNNVMLTALGQQKLVQPLNELIDKWGYNVNLQYKKNPLIETLMTSSDGNVYGIPKYNLNEANNRAQRFWINQKFLDTLGMSVPQTTVEFEAYLKAVKTKDPNSNGKADEIPLIASSSSDGSWMGQLDGFLMMPFVYCDAGNAITSDMKRYIYMDSNGKINFAPVQDGWKAGLKYLNGLYSQGLITSDAFTLKLAGVKSLIENSSAELVGSLPSGGPNAFADANGTRKNDYVVMPPLAGPDGTRQCWINDYGGFVPGNSVIPTASKNQDVTFKLIDYLFSDEQFLRGRYGVKGRDWQVPAAGIKAWDGGQAEFEVISDLKWGQTQNVHLACLYGSYGVGSPHGVDNGDPTNLEKVLWNARVAYGVYDNKKMVPPLILTPDETTQFNDINNTLITYIVQSFAEFVTGTKNIDTDWDDYVAQCKNIGYEKQIMIQQSAFDRTWKSTWSWTTN